MGSNAGYQTYIALSQQAGAKLHVVLEIERAAGFEFHAKSIEVRGFVQLLHTPNTPELLLRILGDRESWCSAIPAAMVGMHGGRSDRRCWMSVEVVI